MAKKTSGVPTEWSTDFRIKIKARLQYLATIQRISGISVADKCGINYTYFNAIINGRQSCSFKMWSRIAEAAGGIIINPSLTFPERPGNVQQ